VQGAAPEIIDLRTIYPWDREMVLSSVRRTGRLLVVHEAVAVGGFGGEIAATVAEELFGALKAPVRRLGAPRIPVPYSPPLEELCKIAPSRIADVAQAMLSYQ
jgi:acetoin:2,6-dichlorophenolindophenol oxidoreductase subunit beta